MYAYGILFEDDVIFVSESGLETPEDIQVLRDNNIGVALMGETFMRSPNKVEKVDISLWSHILHAKG